jgi:hypothetical protein
MEIWMIVIIRTSGSNMRVVTRIFIKHNQNFFMILLLVIPTLMVVTSQYLKSSRGMYYELQFYDPEYAYLLNGLKIIDGQPPDHIDHPGTTVQEYIGLVINIRYAINHFSSTTLSRVEDVLSHPEAYLSFINFALVIPISFLNFLLGIFVYKYTRKLWIAISMQGFPFLSTSIITSLTRVSVEPFLIIVILLIMIVFAKLDYDPKPDKRGYCIGIGLLLGAGIVTKLTFLPFFLLIFWFRKLKDRMMVITTTILSVLVFTLPIWSKINKIYSWVIGLIFKQGYYGLGDAGIYPGSSVIIRNIQSLVIQEPVFFIMFFGLFFILLWCFISGQSLASKYTIELAISFSILLAQLLLTIKFPTPHYLIPSLTWLGFCFLQISRFIDAKIESRSHTRVNHFVTLFSIFLFSVINFISISKDYQYSIGHKATITTDAFLSTNYSNCLIIPYYGASDSTYSLQFGDDFAGNYYSKLLYQHYPKFFSYDIWAQTFNSYKSEISYSKIQEIIDHGNCILLRGGKWLDPSQGYPNPRLNLEKVYSTSSEDVFLLKSIVN